jgi:hypothetical protein
MKVSEIITRASNELNVELSDDNITRLLGCFDMVYEELAVDYFPLTDEAGIPVKDEGFVFYDDFPKKPMRILDVGLMKKSSYRLMPDRIVIKDMANGGYVKITYEYIPDLKGMDDDIEYPDFVRDTLIFGVCSEYCMQEGLWEQAYRFSKYQRYEIHNNHLRYKAMKYLKDA